MIEVEEAIEQLLKAAGSINENEIVSILDAGGRVAAQSIYAPMSVPPFPKSAMDGYAIRSSDSQGAQKENPVYLKVIGQMVAGEAADIKPKQKEALRIMTGAYIPEGFDCVVKQEDTDYGEEQAQIYKQMEPFSNYCKVGEDLKKGQLVLEKNTRLSSAHIGILASLGISKVLVRRKLKVGILSTGSELMDLDQPLAPSKIYNSCGYTLASSLKSAGIDVVFMENCEDDTAYLTKSIQEGCKKADILLTTGGISVGKKDLIPEVITEMGAERLFQKVNMKPGTPVLANQYQNVMILSFSGNPFAALTNFQIFFWPLAAKMMQNEEYNSIAKEAVIAEGKLKKNELRRFVRAFEKNGRVYLPSSVHSSSVLSNMVKCNCLIDQLPHKELTAGDQVRILYLK